MNKNDDDDATGVANKKKKKVKTTSRITTDDDDVAADSNRMNGTSATTATNLDMTNRRPNRRNNTASKRASTSLRLGSSDQTRDHRRLREGGREGEEEEEEDANPFNDSLLEYIFGREDHSNENVAQGAEEHNEGSGLNIDPMLLRKIVAAINTSDPGAYAISATPTTTTTVRSNLLDLDQQVINKAGRIPSSPPPDIEMAILEGGQESIDKSPDGEGNNKVQRQTSCDEPSPEPQTQQPQRSTTRPGAVAVAGIGGNNSDRSLQTTTGGDGGSFQTTTGGSGDDHDHDDHENDNAGLVRADPIQDDDVLPVAEVFVEEATKNPSQQWRRLALVVGAFASLLVVVVSVVIVSRFGAQEQSTATTNASASTTFSYLSCDDESHDDIKAKIKQVLGEEYFDFEDDESNHNDDPIERKCRKLALDWLLCQDPGQLDVHAENLIQRYTLALLYYQTTQEKAWRDCNPPPKEEQKGGNLCAVSNDPNALGERWLTGTHECQWAGVYCEQSGDQNVTTLFLSENGLNGPLPFELGTMSHVATIQLENNTLTDTIPEAFTLLSKLERINLNLNQLKGSIPPRLFSQLEHLNILNLSSNNLSGVIPTEIGLFKGNALRLETNRLAGSIPSEVSQMTNVHHLRLDQNQGITGTIPTSIGAMSQLRYLDFSYTSIYSTIPTEIGKLKALQKFKSEHCNNLEGSIPEIIFQQLEKMILLNVANSNLTGTISPYIGHWTNLRHLDMSSNNFHGSLPAEIAKLTNLATFSLNGNSNLTGSIPEAICSLDISKHESDFSADCTPNPQTGVPAVACPVGCCAMCCDSETNICVQQ